MATREEYIKKINDELELLSDEELDRVAGGDCHETADDSRFLNSLNGSTDRYGATKLFFFGGSVREIEAAWANLGITADLDVGLAYINEYYLNGQKITQEEARQHAMKVTGHYMTRKDWDW